MKIKSKLLAALLLITIMLFPAKSLYSQSNMWVTAYYAGWMQGQNDDGYMTSQNIDFSAVTQVIHFSLVPNSDGSIDYSGNSITPTNSSQLIAKAHAAGVKVIISVGGWSSDTGFRGATSVANLSTFVSNLVGFMQSRGYDGIDIDWETLTASDAVQYSNFIIALRNELNKISPRPLLTAATAWQPAIFGTLSGYFDEINIMSYDMSGAWPGWVTWHNSAVYDGGVKFLSTGAAVPSINTMVNSFKASGIPAAKLGIGMDFYGYVWSGGNGTTTGGVTAPDQSWTTDPSVQSNVPYYSIMDQYSQSGSRKWDSGAQAAYLSIDNSGSASDKFISYDDEATAQAKVDYIKNNGLGGLIIWELGGGYRANMPAGQQDVLLQSVKKAVGGGGTPIADTTPPTISITGPVNGTTVSGSVTISANASDNVGISKVLFQVDGKQIGNAVTSSPYSIALNTTTLTNSQHSLTAKASDAAGNVSSSTVSVNVSNIVAASDTTLPVVTLTSPSNGATLSGTVTVSASATDNVGVTGVTFKIDNTKIGNTLTTSPYSIALNTTNVSNGTHTLFVTAGDAAGNVSTSTLSINVSNTILLPAASDIIIYDDVFSPDWINTSWSITPDFSYTGQVFAGVNSLNIIQKAWGAFRIHSGSWSNPVSIDPGKYTSLEFEVYGESTALNFNMYLESDHKASFPTVNFGSVPANQWTHVSVPISKLNPDNLKFERVIIQDVSGKNVIYDIDNFLIKGTSSNVTAEAPVLLSPANTASDVSISPVLKWNSVTSSSSYTLQVSDKQDFSSTFINKNSITDTAFALNSLTSNKTYYWKVSSLNTSGSNVWSQVFNFTTGVSSVSDTTQELIVYDESLNSQWINTSWNATTDFQNADYASAGNRSIKIIQNAWGGLSLHYGNWGSNKTIAAADYNELTFEIFSPTNINISVLLENDKGSSFTKVNYGTITANNWIRVTIPMSQLNPGNNVIQRIDIMENSGVQKTFYLDNINLSNSGMAKQTAMAKNTNIPTDYRLNQNYPNPFNPSTSIEFSLPSSSHVTLEIFNVLGQKVETLVNKDLSAGVHRFTWNALNFASGIYIYRLNAGNNFILEKKMTLMK